MDIQGYNDIKESEMSELTSIILYYLAIKPCFKISSNFLEGQKDDHSVRGGRAAEDDPEEESEHAEGDHEHAEEDHEHDEEDHEHAEEEGEHTEEDHEEHAEEDHEHDDSSHNTTHGEESHVNSEKGELIDSQYVGSQG